MACIHVHLTVAERDSPPPLGDLGRDICANGTGCYRVTFVSTLEVSSFGPLRHVKTDNVVPVASEGVREFSVALTALAADKVDSDIGLGTDEIVHMPALFERHRADGKPGCFDEFEYQTTGTSQIGKREHRYAPWELGGELLDRL